MIQPNQRRGQALILVTLALVAMCGVMGLAVDLGWAYFVKKSAQAAADAGALAAANAAMALVQQNGTLLSKWATSGVPCPFSGSKTDPISTGCQYAKQVALQPPGFAGSVTMAAGLTGPVPTVPNVNTQLFWVTARAVEIIPNLFSAVLGNPTGISSARATAAVIDVAVNGSLITLDRVGDPRPANLDVTLGSGTLTLPDGLYAAASNNSGQGIQGGGSINGPILEISPATNPEAGGSNVFAALPDGSQFNDPTAFKGVLQPPLTSSVLNTYAVIGGSLSGGMVYQVDGNDNITGGPIPTNALLPGNYFSATAPVSNAVSPTFTQLIASGVTFSNGGTFGNYFFWGGLTVNGTVNLSPGQYVIVGGGLTVNGTFQDPNAATDGGEMIIVTGSTTNQFQGSYPSVTNNQNGNLYSGLTLQVNSNAGLWAILSSNAGLFGPTSFNAAGSGTNDPIGINAANIVGSVSSKLSAFNGVVFWQDQANSTILYNPTPTISPIQIDSGCGGQGNNNYPCPTPSGYAINPNVNLTASGDLGLQGVFYQPRGAGIMATGTVTANLQVITGFFNGSGGGGLVLQDPPIRLKRRIVALIE